MTERKKIDWDKPLVAVTQEVYLDACERGSAEWHGAIRRLVLVRDKIDGTQIPFMVDDYGHVPNGCHIVANAPEPEQVVEGYFNINTDVAGWVWVGCSHDSRSDADRNATFNRIACVKHTITFRPGQYDK